MENKRWKKSKTAVYNINYHLIWCTKYRRKVLSNPIQNRLKELIEQKARQQEWDIKALEVMTDHVHIFVSTNPIDSPHYVIQQIKGMSANLLRREFPELKRLLPTLWTRSYYAESVGHISEETIKKYVENQKNK